MCYHGMGCACCGMGDVSKKDKVAMLKEKEKIMEAKLSAVRQMIDSLESEKEESVKGTS